MKKTYKSIIILSFLVSFLFAAGSAQAAPETVLVLPFKINSSQDLSYIQEGVLDMISSRLYRAGKVIVVDKAVAKAVFRKIKGNIGVEEARELARAHKVDYVLFGTITMIGQAFSLDAKIVNRDVSTALVTAHSESPDLNGVIPSINSFVSRVNEKVFPKTEEKVSESAKSKEPVLESRRHPEYLLKGERRPANSLSRSVDRDMGIDFWKSPTIPMDLTGLDVADIDGDGANEIIYASKNRVVVARYENRRLMKLFEYKGQTSDFFFTLDAADINNNGRAEIFVSCQSQDKFSSLVLELSGGRLVPIVKNSKWAYRVLNTPDGPALYGQKGSVDRLFTGGVFLLKARNKGYEEDMRISLPRNSNVLTFGLINLSGRTDTSLVTLDDSGNMKITTMSGKTIMEGVESYSGSSFFINNPGASSEYPMDRGNSGKKYFLPPRVLIADSDGDGNSEIILAQVPPSFMSSVFSQTRTHKPGKIKALSFSRMSQRENWSTSILAGFPVDYQIKDYNNDGKKELIIAVQVKTGGFTFRKPNAKIIAYSLDGILAADDGK